MQRSTLKCRRGIDISIASSDVAPVNMLASLTDWLAGLGLAEWVEVAISEGTVGARVSCRLPPALASLWLPGFDTKGINAALALDTVGNEVDLEREILLTLAGAPMLFHFPCLDELKASVNIRRNIVLAARKTALSFDTDAVERPPESWHYAEGKGFTLRPGCRLINALQKATQPGCSGVRYAFSCYRATEYVILLGIAKELESCNPNLLAQLERHWQCAPVMSGAFHDVFLHEYGSAKYPIPFGYYVPGDRVWFRNPDPVSSDITGYEGSWVIYLGGGLFSDFWRLEHAYTLQSKCVEIYHWRHGAVQDGQGEWQMDEDRVERLCRETQANAIATAGILDLMMRYRDPRGVQAGGGCIDTSREYPRCVCRGTADMVFPDAAP